ncbi:hypothetical protein H681_02680 [Pseudomonas sp. ATCC 13867]|nr:hypothetical protein H681_02680 [Pseudomonas sp. ATCC 13867]
MLVRVGEIVLLVRVFSGAVLVIGRAFYLYKRRRIVVFRDRIGSKIVFFLSDAVGTAVQLQIERGLLRLDLGRGEHQQSQAEERCYTACGQQMALRVVRRFLIGLRHGVSGVLGM